MMVVHLLSGYFARYEITAYCSISSGKKTPFLEEPSGLFALFFSSIQAFNVSLMGISNK